MEEKGLLQRNPTRGVDPPSQQVLAPRQLSDDQRYILRSLIEEEGDRRGGALFSPCFRAGFPGPGVSPLPTIPTSICSKVGRVHCVSRGGNRRVIQFVHVKR